MAILSVFLSHQNLRPLSRLWTYGWVGVDLFFVLSGFLITGILRRQRHELVYWKPFYLKRATRILPPVIILLAYAYWYEHPPITSMLAYLLFLGNFLYYTRFGVNSLTILWSLAVEEHFYLVFPSAVRKLSRKTLAKLLVCILLLEPLLRLLATHHFANFLLIYVWTCFRLDGLALGALIALITENEAGSALIARWAAPVACLCVTTFVVLSHFVPAFSREQNTLLFNGLGYSLVALSCAGFFGYILFHPGAFVSRVLASPAFVWLGSISYGFYLFHLAVALILGNNFCLATFHSGHYMAPATLIVTALLSWLSFTLYERPISHWGQIQAKRWHVSS